MNLAQVETEIERHFAAGAASAADPAAMEAFLALRNAIERGEIRAAEPDASASTGWRVNAWVKRGILLGFRIGALEQMPLPAPRFLVFLSSTSTPTPLAASPPVTASASCPAALRSAPELMSRAASCACRPCTSTWARTLTRARMVDSHALVGSCAQIGKRVHLSAAAQIGGVLEPVNASPVVIEDDVLVGGNCGVYEGTIVRKGAVLAAGIILTRGTPLFDLVKGEILRAAPNQPLVVPENAVVVPGARSVHKGKGQEWGLSLYAAAIVKYRDDKTDLSTILEELLR